jgi:uncharacterized protein YjiS (DUF1127 family)
MLAHSLSDIEQKASVQRAYNPLDYDINDVMNDAKAMRARYIYAWTGQTWRALAEAWRARRAYRRAVSELSGFSDYELQDIGLSRSDIKSAVYGGKLTLGDRLSLAVAHGFDRVFGALAEWRRHRHTVVELNSLDDHVLRDIGVNRGDITNVVYGHDGAREIVANANQPRTAA